MKKILSLVLVLAMMLSLGALSAFAENDAADVLEIATADELVSFAKSVSDGSMGGYAGLTVVLTADIDCADVEWTPAGTMDLVDMGNYASMFQGTFDGQGHKISNVTWASDDPVVGAGVIGMNLGVVKNLVVENASVTATNPYGMAVGCVVGYNMGMIDNVQLIGTNEVSATNAIGGIAGGSTGSVTNCSVEDVTVHVLGDNDFSDGRIIQCDVAECGGLVIGGAFGGTIDNCTARGTIIAEGNEPVGLGGIAGCLEMMDSMSNCSVNVTIVSAKGGHAIGGLCGYSGTHSDGMIAAETEGVIATKYPAEISNMEVKAVLAVPGATHVGGLVGTPLYYYGEETAFSIYDSTAEVVMLGAVTPGAIAGRVAEACSFENVAADVTLDGEVLSDEVGRTATMYESADQSEEEETAEENDAAAAAKQLLADVTGTYDELFAVICAPEYDQLWLDDCAAIVGDEMAPMCAEMLKTACAGTIYGEEAVAAYADNPEEALFDCFFIGGVRQFVFDGNTISGLDENGETVFSHDYSYVQELSIAGVLDGYLYETEDDDAGEFQYFFLLPDTPGSTYHIEFRYGSDVEALTKYAEGPYGYWLAAGILADRDEQMVEDVIALFCEENLAEMAAAA